MHRYQIFRTGTKMMSLSVSRGFLRGCVIGAAVLAAASAIAGDSRVELSDGSVITGELIGVENGRYRIRSATLGEITIPEASVSTLRPATSHAAEPPPVDDQNATSHGRSDYSADIASIQQRVTSNPDLMAQIFALQNDPDIKSALSDPEFARLILAGDLDKLRADARFQRLAEHPAIRAIMGQMTP